MMFNMHLTLSLSNFSSNLWQVRNVSYKVMRTWYAGLVKPKKPEPPYQHVIQIGDPTLRAPADKVPEDLIKSSEIQFLIKLLKHVCKNYKCVGLSATQIGMPFQMFVMEFSDHHMKQWSPEEIRSKEMTIQPQIVVINPKMKVTDYQKIVFPESCASVRGFFADVPRYRAVELTGTGEDGKPIFLQAAGWLARIIQHEMDHLSGTVYTDIMDRRTLTCSCWDVVNERGGSIELPYGPA